MMDFAGVEMAFQADSIRGAIPIEFNIVQPAPAHVWAAAVARPFDGILLKDALSGIGAGRQRKIDQAIRRGYLLGKTTDQITRELYGTRAAKYKDGIMPSFARKDVSAIVHTAVSHVSSAAREKLYSQNDDIIGGVQIVATLDPETCEVCMGYDGQVYAIEDAIYSPFHYRCRCTTVPVVKSWRDLGLDIAELPPGTRASMDGQVAATETYGSWLGKQSAAVQREALGPARYEREEDQEGEADRAGIREPIR
jgi:SPP1 gp7 family putative phage head morphogenesis protein